MLSLASAPFAFTTPPKMVAPSIKAKSEFTHGRVGMLASAGFLVQENFHPLFSGDGGPAIEQIPALPPAIWFLMTLGVGIAESYRVQKGWANPYEQADGSITGRGSFNPDNFQ